MTAGRTYVIGAGLAGLSAAVRLAAAGARVTLIEGANQAGGRCRSYFDAQLGQIIDNGNHLVLSGNRAVHDYLALLGASDKLAGPDEARFDFCDIRNGARWQIAPNDSALAWWVFSERRRVPGSRLSEYLAIARLLAPKKNARIADTIACEGPLWERLLEPFLLAALNTEPKISAAELAGAVIRETLAKGGRAYRPRIATPHLATAFIDPALAFLKARGAEIVFGKRVRGIGFDGERATTLDIAGDGIALAPDEGIVLATPAWVSADLVPGIVVPDDFRSIVNAHFAFPAPAGAAPMLGVIGGTAEWIFAFEDRLSVTVSGADRLVDQSREELAQTLWADVARAHNLSAPLPAWQIVKERRATFAATPEQNAKRPGAATAYANLVLAGDWTQTHLPATIEGALRSGETAAKLALARRII